MAVTAEFLVEEFRRNRNIGKSLQSIVDENILKNPVEEEEEEFQDRKQVMLAIAESLLMEQQHSVHSAPLMAGVENEIEITQVVDYLGTKISAAYVDLAGNSYDISNLDKIPFKNRWLIDGKPVPNRALNDGLMAINEVFKKRQLARQWINLNTSQQERNNYHQQEVSIDEDSDYPDNMLTCPIMFEKFDEEFCAYIYEDGHSVSMDYQDESPFFRNKFIYNNGILNKTLNEVSIHYMDALSDYKKMIKQHPELEAYMSEQLGEKEKPCSEYSVKKELKVQALQEYIRHLTIRSYLESQKNSTLSVESETFQRINYECLFGMARIDDNYPEIRAQAHLKKQQDKSCQQRFVESLELIPDETVTSFTQIRSQKLKISDKIQLGVGSDHLMEEQTRLMTEQKEIEKKYPDIKLKIKLIKAREESQALQAREEPQAREESPVTQESSSFSSISSFFRGSDNDQAGSKRQAIRNFAATSLSSLRARIFTPPDSSSNQPPIPQRRPRPHGVEYDYLYKIRIIGDSGVGKSCLLLRYADDIFTETYISTIGVDFKIKSCALDNGGIAKLQIWDTAGQERFRDINANNYRGAHAIIIAFDITDRTTFNNVRQWLQEVDRYASERVVRIIVATKCDLIHSPNINPGQIVSDIEIKELEESTRLTVIRTSARTGNNAEMPFHEAARAVFEKTHQDANEARGHRM